jgi:hypothetical protein
MILTFASIGINFYYEIFWHILIFILFFVTRSIISTK